MDQINKTVSSDNARLARLLDEQTAENERARDALAAVLSQLSAFSADGVGARRTSALDEKLAALLGKLDALSGRVSAARPVSSKRASGAQKICSTVRLLRERVAELRELVRRVGGDF